LLIRDATTPRTSLVYCLTRAAVHLRTRIETEFKRRYGLDRRGRRWWTKCAGTAVKAH